MLKPTTLLEEHEMVRTNRAGIAVVGLGYWGPNLLRVLSENPDAEIRWICDLDRMEQDVLSVLAAALTIILITSLLPESLIAAKPEVAQLTAVIHHLEQVRRKIDTELTYDRELLHKETHR